MSALAKHTRLKPERQRVEEYISGVFLKHHAARLKYFLPTLFSLSDDTASIQAAIGVGKLNKEKIFLEQYLPQPVESSVSVAARRIVARSNIAEVGNLACSSGGASRQLIAVLSQYLSDLNIEWAVFTGTTMVNAILRRLRIETVCLGVASPECMGKDLGDWGTYYSHNPRIMLVNVEQARTATSGLFQLKADAHV